MRLEVNPEVNTVLERDLPPTLLPGNRRSDRAYVPALTGLRGLAITFVAMSHAHVPGLSIGRWGVDVFFVLSGYLITTMLRALVLRTPKDLVSLRRAYGFFLARRIARLLPAFVVVLAIVTCWAVLSDRPRSIECSVLALTYTMNLPIFSAGSCTGPFHITWSLAVEEQFYLVWPLLVVALSRLRTVRAARICLWMYAGFVVAVQLTLHVAPEAATWLGYAPGGRSAALFLGAAAAFAVAGAAQGVRRAQSGPHVRRPIGDASSLGVHLALPACLFGIAMVAAVLDGQLKVMTGPLVATLTACLVYVLVRRTAGFATKVLSGAWLVWLGEVSYSLYLVHVLVLHMMRQVRGDDSLLTNLLGLLVATAAAAVLHRWVEAPLRLSGYAWLSAHEMRAARRSPLRHASTVPLRSKR